MSVAAQVGVGLPAYFLSSLLVCCLAWAYSAIMHVVITNVSLAVQYEKQKLSLQRIWMNLKDAMLNELRQTKKPNTLLLYLWEDSKMNFEFIKWQNDITGWESGEESMAW